MFSLSKCPHDYILSLSQVEGEGVVVPAADRNVVGQFFCLSSRRPADMCLDEKVELLQRDNLKQVGAIVFPSVSANQVISAIA